MNPVTVEPLSETATLTAAMNPSPPSIESTSRRSRLGPFRAARVGRGMTPSAAAAITTGRAIVQASAAIPSGVNERSATPVAG